MEYSFEVRSRLPSFNEIVSFAKTQSYGSRYNSTKKRCEKIISDAIGEYQHNSIKNADIHMCWHEQYKRRDPDNIAAACKYVIDAMVSRNIIKDDTYKFIKSITHTFVFGSSFDGVVVDLEGEECIE